MNCLFNQSKSWQQYRNFDIVEYLILLTEQKKLKIDENEWRERERVPKSENVCDSWRRSVKGEEFDERSRNVELWK